MNLGKTLAEWKRLLGREFAGLLLAPLREAREIRDKYSLERTQILNIGDRAGATANIIALTLAGVNYSVNTSVEGRLYVRFVANGGDWDVSFYTAVGAAGLVAHVTALADGGTAALVADNASGLSGSITIGAAVTADATDRHMILVIVDYPARLPKALTQTDGIEDDMHSQRIIAALYATIASLEEQKIRAIIAAATAWALGDADNLVGRGLDFTGTAETTLVEDVADPDASGNVARSRGGWLYTLKDAMEDEATGGEIDIVKRVVSAAAGVFEAGNDGLGSVAAHTPREKCRAGTWSFECVDDTLGRERFNYNFRAADSDDTLNGTGPQVKKEWSGPQGFGPITLARTYSKTNDGADLRFDAASLAVVTGETSLNTDDGVLYIKIEANAANWDISFYSASSLHSSKLVAKATNIVTNAAFTATEQNASGVEVSWSMGGTPSAVSNITLDLNPFKVENAGGVRDRFTIAVTVAALPGVIQTILAEELEAELNSDTLASEAISDDYVKAGTFHPFITLRN